MDNRSAAIRDNTYGDFETMSDGRLIKTIYRYFPYVNHEREREREREISALSHIPYL